MVPAGGWRLRGRWIFLFGRGWFGITTGVVFGLLTGLLARLIVFGRRAERAAYAQVEGQAGAAAGVLQMLKRGWDVTPAISFTKNQDVVHRVVGRPGIVLVGEGNPTRSRTAQRRAQEAPRIGGEEIPVTRSWWATGGRGSAHASSTSTCRR